MKLSSKLVVAALSFATVMGLASCDKRKTLNLYTWTYYTPAEVVEAFEAEFDCKVVVTEYDSNETMYTKLLNGGAGSFDIVVPSQDYVSIMMAQNMLQPIVQEKFTNRDKINPKVLEKATYDPEMKYAVPYYFGAAGISVNKTKVTNPDYARDWSIFEDEQFKGHASMMDDYREVMGDALMHKGYNVCSVNDSELDTVTSYIKTKWLPNIVKFDAEGFGKDFASGNLWLCQGYAEVVNGEVTPEFWEKNVDFFIPAEGGPSYLDSMCILKDSKNAELATEFINFIHRPENYAKFLDSFMFPCYVNTEAEAFMTTTPIYKASELDNCQLKMDLGEDIAKYTDRWEKQIRVMN